MKLHLLSSLDGFGFTKRLISDTYELFYPNEEIDTFKYYLLNQIRNELNLRLSNLGVNFNVMFCQCLIFLAHRPILLISVDMFC